jgi:hypothetical protein
MGRSKTNILCLHWPSSSCEWPFHSLPVCLLMWVPFVSLDHHKMTVFAFYVLKSLMVDVRWEIGMASFSVE